MGFATRLCRCFGNRRFPLFALQSGGKCTKLIYFIAQDGINPQKSTSNTAENGRKKSHKKTMPYDPLELVSLFRRDRAENRSQSVLLEVSSLQSHETVCTFPGFMIWLGSMASFTAFIRLTVPSPSSETKYSFLPTPTPCSPVPFKTNSVRYAGERKYKGATYMSHQARWHASPAGVHIG